MVRRSEVLSKPNHLLATPGRGEIAAAALSVVRAVGALARTHGTVVIAIVTH